MIKIVQLSKTYKLNKDIKVSALHDINMTIPNNSFVAIVGASGSGKSTLLNILAGLDWNFEGDIFINKKNTKGFNQDIYRRQISGIIFQQFNLIPSLTVAENIMLPNKFSKIYNKEQAQKRLHQLIQAVGLEKRINHKPTELSGGQAQRVAIARALFNNPKILLADEPTGNLDSKTGNEILELLREINEKEKTTVIIATHNNDIIKSANLIFKLKDGILINEKI